MSHEYNHNFAHYKTSKYSANSPAMVVVQRVRTYRPHPADAIYERMKETGLHSDQKMDLVRSYMQWAGIMKPRINDYNDLV